MVALTPTSPHNLLFLGSLTGQYRAFSPGRNEKPTKAGASVGLNDFYDFGDS